MDFLTAADAEQLGGECYRLIIALVRLNKRPDGTVPSCQEVRGLIEERVQRSPRLRQFPYQPPGYSGLPAWADGQDFDIDDHLVRAEPPETRTILPAPWERLPDHPVALPDSRAAVRLSSRREHGAEVGDARPVLSGVRRPPMDLILSPCSESPAARFSEPSPQPVR